MSVLPSIRNDEDLSGKKSEEYVLNTDSLEDQAVCRICLDSEDKQLIRPCSCSGTSAFVHESCLKTWILMKSDRLEKATCEICKNDFKVCICSRLYCRSIQDKEKRLRFYCKILILTILTLIITSIISYAFVFYIDIQKKPLYSGFLIFSCGLPLSINLFLILKLILSNYCSKEIVSIEVLSSSASTNIN